MTSLMSEILICFFTNIFDTTIVGYTLFYLALLSPRWRGLGVEKINPPPNPRQRGKASILIRNFFLQI